MVSRLLGLRPSTLGAPDRSDYLEDDGRRFVVGQALALVWLSLLRFVFTWRPGLDPGERGSVVMDLGIDLACVGLIVLVYARRNPVFLSPAGRARLVGSVVVLVWLVRAVLMLVEHAPDLAMDVVRHAAIALLLVLLGAIGLLGADVGVRTRVRERSELEARMRAAEADAAVVRREIEIKERISQRLHGSLQQSIVLVEWRVKEILRSARATSGDPQLVDDLAVVSRELERIRETDVRAATEWLRPTAIGLGAPQAIRLLLQRLPAHISFSLSIDERLEALEPMDDPRLDLETRDVVVEIVQEGVTNALKHGGAEHVEVSVQIVGDAGAVIEVAVVDSGSGLVSQAVDERGVAALRRRAEARGGSLELVPGAARGACLRAVVPLADEPRGDRSSGSART